MSQETNGLHIGIIPDGSRRWSKFNNIPKGDWSRSGETTDKIVRHLFNNHPEIKEVSLWAMSTENVDRDDYSRNLVYSLLKGKMNDLLNSPIIKDKNVVVNVVGSRLGDIPKDIRNLSNEIVSRTEDHESKRILNICIGYGGRQEITDAVMSASKWLRKNPTIAKLHENVFEKFLMIPRNLDIVIRTGGEKRLSGFMLYQIEYAELFFSDTLWPDFNTKELDDILNQFANRRRTFGR